jgi:hypothetical protein
MARNPNVPFKGRIQKRKTNQLQIITFGLQRAAGPYSCARSGCEHTQQRRPLFDHLVGATEQREREGDSERFCGFQVQDQLNFGNLLDRQVGRFLTLERHRLQRPWGS